MNILDHRQCLINQSLLTHLGLIITIMITMASPVECNHSALSLHNRSQNGEWHSRVTGAMKAQEYMAFCTRRVNWNHVCYLFSRIVKVCPWKWLVLISQSWKCILASATAEEVGLRSWHSSAWSIHRNCISNWEQAWRHWHTATLRGCFCRCRLANSESRKLVLRRLNLLFSLSSQVHHRLVRYRCPNSPLINIKEEFLVRL